MPQKEHLPRVSDKEQRMYEHVEKSELKRGRSRDRAKEIAAATVAKHHNENDHASGRLVPAKLTPLVEACLSFLGTWPPECARGSAKPPATDRPPVPAARARCRAG